MSYFEIVLIALSLCFDTLAISMIGGACMNCLCFWKRLKILFFFAFFQGGLTFAGWLLGSTVSQYVEKFDHWVAFGLLAYIGGKMIAESLSKKEEGEKVDLLKTGSLIVASIATSIDAFAVGISFSMLGDFNLSKISLSTLIIALITALAAAVGLRGGEKLGSVLGKKCDFVGGIVLVTIGIKILLEHLV